MVTYEKAYEIAKDMMPNIDACVEYENAYMFKRKAANHSIGGDGFCIILKESGKKISQTEFFDSYDAAIVREFDLGSDSSQVSKSKKRSR